MLEKYFGFHDDPFVSTPNPFRLFQSPSHQEVLASLRYGFINNRGFTALIGPPGTGKTSLLFRFLEDIQGSCRSVFLFAIDPECKAEGLIEYILRDLGVVPGNTCAHMQQQLRELLIVEAQAGRKFVIVIDEAHNLSAAVLEMVRMLSNFETPRGKLLQIVLAGQPELADTLAEPSLIQLRQRISTICRLEPLSKEIIEDYISDRLASVGYMGPKLFAPEALELIRTSSDGIPRSINNLCFNSLSICCALGKRQVDKDMVAEVITDQTLPRADLKQPHLIFLQSTELAKYDKATPAMAHHRPRRWTSIAAAVSSVTLCLLTTSFSPTPRLRSKIIASTILTTAPEEPTPDFKEFVSTKQPSQSFSSDPFFQLSSDQSISINGVSPRLPSPNKTASWRAPSFGIKVARKESLGKISLLYLGQFNSEKLRQIRELNPWLSDPNHLEPGQIIRLPGVPANRVAQNAPHQTPF